MTQEQWIIYLYSIYPNGGITAVTCIATGILLITSGISFITYKDNIDFGGSSERKAIESFEKNELLFQRAKKFMKPMIVMTIITVTIGYFIPDRSTFVGIVATPSIVKSYTDKDGKLNKIDSIIDKILERTEMKLSDDKVSKCICDIIIT